MSKSDCDVKPEGELAVWATPRFWAVVQGVRFLTLGCISTDVQQLSLRI